ncbi:hypothetical protein DFA_06532 [Cavenderia fasciculata]|uniref:Protein kinase domain-containing protein n=1 Tax=Cavenderia fasciculata TaxID=261658 RepID=F4PJ96_CACFS|nr:uncharacterized protein DFA_06532 [Cavenderia fasciculata]EGG24382.1 hypothetical protein DFA_06532 [Cavenderia fasciculata]|eukprot:XP_004362233.1 hypothetical protein DFA_06532 [Cavenderia fasciculata]
MTTVVNNWTHTQTLEWVKSGIDKGGYDQDCLYLKDGFKGENLTFNSKSIEIFKRNFKNESPEQKADDQKMKEREQLIESLFAELERLFSQTTATAPKTNIEELVLLISKFKVEGEITHPKQQVDDDLSDLDQDFKSKLVFEKEGMSSRVFSALVDGKSYFIKIYKKPHFKSNEEKRLQSLKDFNGVPKIIRSSGDSSKWMVMSPLGSVINTSIAFKNWGKIIQILLDVHKNNIIHRDIGPSNIILSNESKEPILIDWSSSVLFSGNPSPYEGCYYTASNNVLISMVKSNGTHTSTPNDDLESCIKTMIILTVRNVKRKVLSVGVDSPRRLIDVWNKIEKKRISPYHVQLLALSRNGSHKELIQLLHSLQTESEQQ